MHACIWRHAWRYVGNLISMQIQATTILIFLPGSLCIYIIIQFITWIFFTTCHYINMFSTTTYTVDSTMLMKTLHVWKPLGCMNPKPCMYVFEVSSYFTFGRETRICLSHKILIVSGLLFKGGKKREKVQYSDERYHREGSLCAQSFLI